MFEDERNFRSEVVGKVTKLLLGVCDDGEGESDDGDDGDDLDGGDEVDGR
jgi:hypothetical protein